MLASYFLFCVSFRHFRLHLTPHSELFAEDFHAYSVAENYPEKELTVDLEGFYKGYDEGKVFSCKCILLVSPENE